MTYGRILVTGGAGFIGSHLVDALLASGREVIAYDDLSMGRRSNVSEDATFIEGDVRDTERLHSILQSVDAVCHLAARVSIRSSVDYFVEDADINVLGTLSVLHACAGTSVKKLILASSMGVYTDSPEPKPVPETYTTEPLSPYGIGKLAAEKYCLQIAPTLGVRPVALRFFNTFGTRQTLTPYVGVITIFIRRLLAGDAPTIFGAGEQCRDFVHVSDVAAACVLALDADIPAVALNIGTGIATSVNRIAGLLGERIAPHITPLYAPQATGELQNCIADITQARRLLRYQPRATLESRIDEVIAYLKT